MFAIKKRNQKYIHSFVTWLRFKCGWAHDTDIFAQKKKTNTQRMDENTNIFRLATMSFNPLKKRDGLFFKV